MATKTFEELKQLAIQIRDEKTKKANTATRIGTQMIEHLNKLEQEYYNIQTVDGLVSEYNVSVNHPTSGIDGSNKYTLSSAIALVPEKYRSIGIKCSFVGEDDKPECWEYQGGRWITASFVQIDSGRFEQLGVYTENSEFVYLVKDAEDRILFGIKKDGKPYFPQNEIYHVMENDEFSILWLSGDYPLMGIKRDGSFWCAKSSFLNTIDKIQEAFLRFSGQLGDLDYIKNTLYESDNDEYLYVITDAKGRFLFGITQDGIPHFPHNEMYHIVENDEFLCAWVDTTDKILYGIKRDGKFYASLGDGVNAANQYLSTINDDEGRSEIITDKEGKIIGYRKDGIKHEIVGFDTNQYFYKGKKVNFATKEDIRSIELKNLNGVKDYDKENLFKVEEFTESFFDGKNTFAPPAANLARGYRMSNRISCTSGDYFTRNGTATAVVVVTDKDDTNGQKIPTPGQTFQIPEEWDWASYVRAVAINDGTAILNKGKYLISGGEKKNAVGIENLKLSKSNFTLDTKYLQAPNGKWFELKVDNTGTLTTQEIDSEVIPEFDLPAEFPGYKIMADENISFNGQFDRILLANYRYLMEFKETGVTNIYDMAGTCYNYNNFEHFYNKKGQGRYVFMMINGTNTGLPYVNIVVFDENWNLIDNVPSPLGDPHDFIYIDDYHYIIFSNTQPIPITYNGKPYTARGVTIKEIKKGKVIATYVMDDERILKDLIFDDPGGTLQHEVHFNTIDFDRTENRVIINLRNCDCWLVIARNVDGESVSYGPILNIVGGRHNSDNYEAVERIKTPDLCQWFHSHDIKYWGEKEINGKRYPTYTMFDNNYFNVLNERNNPDTNPAGGNGIKPILRPDFRKITDDGCSRVVQMSIDWDSGTIVDYRVYYIPQYYSFEQGGATMYDEGIISIAYSYMGVCGLFDFTTEKTVVSEDGHLYKDAVCLWKLKFDKEQYCYRSNTYTKN